MTHFRAKQVNVTTSLEESFAFPDVEGAFRKLWGRIHGCQTWNSPSLLELAVTLTTGKINTDDFPQSIALPTWQISQEFMLNFTAFARFMLDIEHAPDELLSASGGRKEYKLQVRLYCHYSWVFHTSRDWLRMGHRCAKVGDLLVVFDNGPTPYIIRLVSDKPGKFILMGPCFVYYLASGQINDLMGQEGFEERTFDLI